jgi:F0F1-type ATP synthase membrane subunit b/b'
MDILHLVDRLEELFNDSRPIRLMRKVVVDEDKLLSIIDQMRVSIPDEIKKAQQLLSQRDRLIAQGQEEANRTLQIAREKANQLVEKDAIIQSAQMRANQIIEQAKKDSEINRIEADRYIITSLSDLEQELEVLLVQVKNGITALQNIANRSEQEQQEE